GTLHHLSFPPAPPSGSQMRIETGVTSGDAVTPFYDPMIAKIVVHADDRAAALGALAKAIEGTEIAGSVTNLAFLAALARDADFAAGDVDTGLIGRKQDELTRPAEVSPETVARAVLVASGLDRPGPSPDPWNQLQGYAHFFGTPRRTLLKKGETSILARVAPAGNNRFSVTVDGDRERLFNAPTGLDFGARFARWPDHVTIFENGHSFNFEVPDPLAKGAETAAGTASLRAPMPGLVKLVRAAKGDAVLKGQPLLILEAMKMEHTIAAPHNGVIAEIAAEGAQVTDGTVLVKFAEDTQV
ncbi:MAG TPA: biotin/lipoyl-containing protein, partial [Mesorhizobium sp.]